VQSVKKEEVSVKELLYHQVMGSKNNYDSEGSDN